MKTLSQGAEKRRLVELEYLKEGEEEPTTRLVEPYTFERELPFWRVHTWDRTVDGPRTYRLDRMRSARLTSERFEPREGFDPNYLSEPAVARLWHAPAIARWKLERGARQLTDKAAAVGAHLQDGGVAPLRGARRPRRDRRARARAPCGARSSSARGRSRASSGSARAGSGRQDEPERAPAPASWTSSSEPPCASAIRAGEPEAEPGRARRPRAAREGIEPGIDARPVVRDLEHDAAVALHDVDRRRSTRGEGRSRRGSRAPAGAASGSPSTAGSPATEIDHVVRAANPADERDDVDRLAPEGDDAPGRCSSRSMSRAAAIASSTSRCRSAAVVRGTVGSASSERGQRRDRAPELVRRATLEPLGGRVIPRAPRSASRPARRSAQHGSSGRRRSGSDAQRRPPRRRRCRARRARSAGASAGRSSGRRAARARRPAPSPSRVSQSASETTGWASSPARSPARRFSTPRFHGQTSWQMSQP